MIVGAGTIGLELAASATQRGCKVTVIELAASPAWRRVKQRSPSASSNGSGRAAAPVAIKS
ncbi:NAD-binding protein [Escherichia coli]|uniref:NAD-binding protein n=1 Tax=Escherichia coli TaxID=562 RepID=UPI003D8147C3